MQRIVLLIEYDGAQFVGFQAQGDLPTIEDTLRQALASLHIPVLSLVVAGRTDAGVHALAQIIHIDTTSTMAPRRIAPGLNFFLPPTIRVQRSELALPGFHARLMSTAKHYRYCLWLGLHPPAVQRGQLWHLRGRLASAAMQQAAQQLVGHHDFEAFRSVHCDAAHARRAIYALTISWQPTANLGQLAQIDLYGNAFCRHMCRILVGTLVAVGRGQLTVAQVGALLLNRDRKQAGMTAPAHGLTLIEIAYAPHVAPSWQVERTALQQLLPQQSLLSK